MSAVMQFLLLILDYCVSIYMYIFCLTCCLLGSIHVTLCHLIAEKLTTLLLTGFVLSLVTSRLHAGPRPNDHKHVVEVDYKDVSAVKIVAIIK